jgi:hypothetical protein
MGVRGSTEEVPLENSAVTPENQGALEAVSPAYTDLIAQAETYDGALLTYHGFVTKTSQEGGEWLTSMALRKTDAGYADTVILVSDADPGIAIDTEVLIYGVMVGINVREGGDLAALGYPRIQLESIEAAKTVAI